MRFLMDFQIPGLLDHLKDTHGPPRFTCGVCQVFKSSSSYKVQAHLKIVHQVTRTVIKPKDAFKTDKNIDDFFFNPKVDPPPRPAIAKSGTLKKFSPGQEDLLPTTHIFPVSFNFSLPTSIYVGYFYAARRLLRPV